MPKDLLTRHTIEASVIEHFASVLFPVDLITLLDMLPQKGWVVPRRFRVDAEGLELEQAPSKGSTHLRIDQRSKFLGVGGKDLPEVLKVFRELHELVYEDIGLSTKVESDWVELRYVGWLKGQDPVKAFSNWWRDVEPAARLGRLLAERLPSDTTLLAPYGIRFAPSGLDPNRPNWAEVTVVPQIIAGTTRYQFDLIFRNQDWKIAEKVAEIADEMLDSVISEIEERRP